MLAEVKVVRLELLSMLIEIGEHRFLHLPKESVKLDRNTGIPPKTWRKPHRFSASPVPYCINRACENPNRAVLVCPSQSKRTFVPSHNFL